MIKWTIPLACAFVLAACGTSTKDSSMQSSGASTPAASSATGTSGASSEATTPGGMSVAPNNSVVSESERRPSDTGVGTSGTSDSATSSSSTDATSGSSATGASDPASGVAPNNSVVTPSERNPNELTPYGTR